MLFRSLKIGVLAMANGHHLRILVGLYHSRLGSCHNLDFGHILLGCGRILGSYHTLDLYHSLGCARGQGFCCRPSLSGIVPGMAWSDARTAQAAHYAVCREWWVCVPARAECSDVHVSYPRRYGR